MKFIETQVSVHQSDLRRCRVSQFSESCNIACLELDIALGTRMVAQIVDHAIVIFLQKARSFERALKSL